MEPLLETFLDYVKYDDISIINLFVLSFIRDDYIIDPVIIILHFYQVLPNGNLVFPPFRAEDYRQEVHAQVYICLAKNPVGSIHSRDVNVRAGKFRNIFLTG